MFDLVAPYILISNNFDPFEFFFHIFYVFEYVFSLANMSLSFDTY